MCPCGSGVGIDACCGPVLADAAPAPTAEALMRSRFTAFAQGDAEHLARTWAPETRPAEIRLAPTRRWTRLEVLDTKGGRALDATGEVEFRAHYDDGGRIGSLHERSTFRRERGRWVYVDGVR